MLILYQRTGSAGFELGGPSLLGTEETKLISNATRVLEVRGHVSAARHLHDLPFTLMEGNNDFLDTFSVLIAKVPLNTYEALRAQVGNPGGQGDFRAMADVVTELGPYIRFVAVDLDLDSDVGVVLTDDERARALTAQEVNALVFRYIGVEGGYLGDFSYQSHFDFYADLELPVDPYQYQGTTRERFTRILTENPPAVQAIILEGILRRFPCGSSELRTEERVGKIQQMITRLRGTSPVAPPSPKVTSGIVERALADAEQLIETAGPTSAVDRVHTAFHGYLRAVCTGAGLTYDQTASIGKLLGIIRDQHPDFTDPGPRGNDIRQIMRSMAAIADALNPVRNEASVAHPNAVLLEPAEAMLVINSIRTLLHYVDQKVRHATS